MHGAHDAGFLGIHHFSVPTGRWKETTNQAPTIAASDMLLLPNSCFRSMLGRTNEIYAIFRCRVFMFMVDLRLQRNCKARTIGDNRPD
jgi:hypothetical protein